MKLKIEWRKYLEDVNFDIPEIEDPETHEKVGSQEIVEPPQDGEDKEQAHGGDDACSEVEDAPEREEANGASEEKQDHSESEGDDENPLDLEGSNHSDDFEEETSDSSSDGDYKRQSKYDNSLEYLRIKRIQNAVATVISKVAEDLSGYDTDGDDLWDIQAIMTRRFTRRPIYSCRKSLEKEKIIIGLDFSGSCREYSEFFASVLKSAEELNDVEIVDASNGFGTGEYTTYSITYKVERPFSYFGGRTVIFFGDFDGGASIVELSRIAKVYWFSCEERYEDLDEHNWCEGYTLHDFKGKYYKCTSEMDFLRLMKKIR